MRLKYAIAISVLSILAIIGLAIIGAQDIVAQEEKHTAGESLTCNTMIIAIYESGSFECVDGVAHFEFPPTNTFVCWLDSGLLNCNTGKSTFSLTAPELPTPTPDLTPIPTISNEEWQEMQDNDEVAYNLTTFHDCNSYSVGVSTTESLGGGEVICSQAPNTFMISLPENIDHISCDRSIYDGWSCGAGKQQFWFYQNLQ